MNVANETCLGLISRRLFQEEKQHFAPEQGVWFADKTKPLLALPELWLRLVLNKIFGLAFPGFFWGTHSEGVDATGRMWRKREKWGTLKRIWRGGGGVGILPGARKSFVEFKISRHLCGLEGCQSFPYLCSAQG